MYGSGEYVSGAVADVDACCSACAAASKCKAFTYASDTGICYLKDNDADCGAKEHRTSGGRAVPAWHGAARTAHIRLCNLFGSVSRSEQRIQVRLLQVPRIHRP